MSLPVEAGRSELDRRPGKETPCPQPFSTCPSPSTDSSPGPMRDRTTASVTAGTACTSGTGDTVAITLADTIVVGRKAFPDMAAHWTTADGDLAAWLPVSWPLR